MRKQTDRLLRTRHCGHFLYAQSEPETVAHANLAADTNTAVHELDQPFADNQTDPRALLGARTLTQAV